MNEQEYRRDGLPACPGHGPVITSLTATTGRGYGDRSTPRLEVYSSGFVLLELNRVPHPGNGTVSLFETVKP